MVRSADVGFTTRLNAKLETGVGVQYVNYNDFDDTSIKGRVSFTFAPNWSLTAQANAGATRSAASSWA